MGGWVGGWWEKGKEKGGEREGEEGGGTTFCTRIFGPISKENCLLLTFFYVIFCFFCWLRSSLGDFKSNNLC